MQDPKKIIGNSLLSSIEGLSDCYDTLASMTENDRKLYIQKLIEINEEIKSKIASDKTQNAIRLLIRFQYIVRYKFRIDEPDYFLESSFEHLCHRKDKHEENLRIFKDFKWNAPAESDYIAFVTTIFSKCDFYDRVNFVTHSSHPASLPSSDMPYEEWLDREFISTQHDKRQYNNELNEANKKLFFKKSAINEVKSKWNEIIRRHEGFRKEIADIFQNLYSSKKWLEDLKLAELEKGIELREITNANKAIEQGVQKKHLLAENALEAIDSYQKITRGM